MSSKKSISQITKHKQKALNDLDLYMESLIQSSDSSKADKLAYWISDYTRLLNKERTFDPTKSIAYHRGDIVKVHLGYRIGNEEGGLHFGVVIDNHNSKRSGIVTIVPLTSQKSGKKIHPDSVFLGSEIFQLINSKHINLVSELTGRLSEIYAEIGGNSKEALDQYFASLSEEDAIALKAKLDFLQAKLAEANEIYQSIVKMKNGSIALVNQITTISKIRIYDPVYSNNVLYGLRISSASLDLIDEKIKKLFMKK